MWAVGCVLLEMLTGQALWDMEDELGVKSLEDPSYTRDFITSDSRIAKYDPKLRSIAKKLLHPDPIQRLTVDELLKK